MSSPEIDAPAQLTPEAKQLLSATVRGLRQRLLRDLRDSAEREYRLAVPLGKAGLGEAQRVRRQRLEHWLDAMLRQDTALDDRYRELLWSRERFAHFELDGAPMEGRPLDVDRTGRLLVETADGRVQAFGLDRLRFAER